MNAAPVIGLVGSHGAYGRWLQRFFAQQMGLMVLGHDPGDATTRTDPDALLEAADVLLFATPIHATAAIVSDYVRRAAGRERGRLWLDVTSIKAAPVAAMLASQAEVVGLHPMAAPPKAPTLKGHVLIVCEARLERWRPWLERLLAALQADCVAATPEQHDALMAVIQAMVHASHLAQVAVLRQAQPWVHGPADVMPFRTRSFELDMTVAMRILAGNPAIYEDIQFCNPAVRPVLQRLIDALVRIRDCIDAGDSGRARFREEFLAAGRAFFGGERLAQGDYGFERIGYLLSDLEAPQALSVHLPDDRPGALRELLAVFERHGVNLASIHSSRTPAGEVHFRLGYAAGTATARLDAVLADIAAVGCGRVLD